MYYFKKPNWQMFTTKTKIKSTLMFEPFNDQPSSGYRASAQQFPLSFEMDNV